jgi:DNA-directed RNA polymerase subunit RPC12/RpoP
MSEVSHEAFDCVECGRHVLRFAPAPDVKLCANCVSMPGWFEDPEVCALFDPDYARLLDQQVQARRAEVRRRVEEHLGQTVICTRCGAQLATFGERCAAALDEACPGFQAIERVRAPIVAEVYGFAPAERGR